MNRRSAETTRETTETDITTAFTINGTGKAHILTGCDFFDHMLETLAVHGLFNVVVRCNGDLNIDAHHTIEDVAITLGTAVRDTIEQDNTLNRYGHAKIPLDETLAEATIDTCSRPYYNSDISFSQPYVSSIPAQLFDHFFRSFAMSANLTLHVSTTGSNTHHEIEALFKAVARALDEATEIDARRESTPSTKNKL